MARQTFTKKQIKALEDNKYVLKCTPKRIVFTDEFKLHAVDMYSKGFTPTHVFNDAGLDIDLVDRHNAYESVMRWRKQLKEYGQFRNDRSPKNKKPKKKIPKDEKERMEYLEAKVKYLEAENDFLAKLRAKRRAEK